jgi:hypothetical protein
MTAIDDTYEERNRKTSAFCCIWKRDGKHRNWLTSCGRIHNFYDDDCGPTESDHVFCPYCGKLIREA